MCLHVQSSYLYVHSCHSYGHWVDFILTWLVDSSHKKMSTGRTTCLCFRSPTTCTCTCTMLAPEITGDEVAHLKVLIETHHTSLLTYTQTAVSSRKCSAHASPDLKTKAFQCFDCPHFVDDVKFHVCTRMFGPLSKHWTMRYEARHKYFKKLAQNIGNFINLPWTLAMRHQLLQCYYRSSRDDRCHYCG